MFLTIYLGVITIRKEIQADERARNLVIHTAVLWGWRDRYNTYRERSNIGLAVCKQVAYDLGYPKALASYQLPIWFAKLNDFVTFGENQDPISPSHS